MIRLLISDDSAFMRIAIRKMVEGHADIEVVGEAKTGQMSVQMAEELKPDVITMDVEMPVMDGLEATRQIMSRCPCPIIMLSSLTERNSVTTIKQARAVWPRPRRSTPAARCTCGTPT